MRVSSPALALFRHALCAVVLAATATLAHAVDRRVPSQYPTIQAAINAAASNGDRVLIANGTYTGVGNRNMDLGTKNLVIQSESDNPAYCFIDCQNLDRGFVIRGGQTSATMIRGISIYNGKGGLGAGISNYTPASLINCRIIGCRSNGRGGGVFNWGGTVTNCTFIGNTAYLSGGGLDDMGGVVTGCTFQQNTAQSGAGLTASSGTRVANCSFIANTAVANESGFIGTGAIHGMNGDHSEINCIFVRNTGGTGAIYNQGGGTQINCSFYSNKAIGNGSNTRGGAIYNRGNAKQVNCIIYGNTTTGAASTNEIYNDGPGSVQTNCIIGGLPISRDANGNFGANPQFYNAAGDDLHLSLSSPAINAGVNVTNPDIATDMEGFPRITGGVRDIGAYELHSDIVAFSQTGVNINRYQVVVGLVNRGRFTETNVKITSATLGGIPTATALPQNPGTILVGETKSAVLSFPYAYPYGSYQLIVSGTTSIGPFTNYIPVFVY